MDTLSTTMHSMKIPKVEDGTFEFLDTRTTGELDGFLRSVEDSEAALAYSEVPLDAAASEGGNPPSTFFDDTYASIAADPTYHSFEPSATGDSCLAPRGTGTTEESEEDWRLKRVVHAPGRGGDISSDLVQGSAEFATASSLRARDDVQAKVRRRAPSNNSERSWNHLTPTDMSRKFPPSSPPCTREKRVETGAAGTDHARISGKEGKKSSEFDDAPDQHVRNSPQFVNWDSKTLENKQLRELLPRQYTGPIKTRMRRGG